MKRYLALLLLVLLGAVSHAQTRKLPASSVDLSKLQTQITALQNQILTLTTKVNGITTTPGSVTVTVPAASTGINGATQLALDAKLGITAFNTYAGSVNGLLDTKQPMLGYVPLNLLTYKANRLADSLAFNAALALIDARVKVLEGKPPVSVTVTQPPSTTTSNPASLTGVNYSAAIVEITSLAALRDSINKVPINNTVRRTFLMAPGNYTITGESVVINSRPLIEIAARKINTVHIYNGDANLSTFYVTGNSRHPVFTQLNLHGTINGSSPVYKSLIQTDYTTKADSLEVRFCSMDNPKANQNLISIVPYNQVVGTGIPAIAYNIHHNRVKGGGRAFVEANGHGHERGDSTAYIVNWHVDYNDVDSVGLVDPSYGVLVSLSGRNEGCWITYNKAKDCSFAAYEVVAGRNARLWYNTMTSSMNLPGCTGISISSADLNGQKLYNYNIDIKGGSGYARMRAFALYHIRGFTVESVDWSNEYFNEVYSCAGGTIQNSNFTHTKGSEWNPSSGNVWQINASNNIKFINNTTLQNNLSQTNYSALSLGVTSANISTNCTVTGNTFARMGSVADTPVHNESSTNIVRDNF